MYKKIMVVLILVGIGGGVLLKPTPAYACIWDPTHYFMPLPPCPVDDKPGQSKVKEMNKSLLAKLTLVAGKATMVAVEIRKWRQAYDTAMQWDDRINRAWGDLTAPPLPSLVAHFQHTPMARWVEVELDESGEIQVELVDIRAEADSLWDHYTDEEVWEQIYEKSWGRSYERMGRVVTRGVETVGDELQSMLEWQEYAQTARDSLWENTRRTAMRYEGETSTEGMAEAQISNMSALLTKLRGSAYDAQVKAIESRMQALEMAQSKRYDIEQDAAKTSQFSAF